MNTIIASNAQRISAVCGIISLLLCAGLAKGEPWGNDPSHNMVRPAKNVPVMLDETTLIWEKDTGAKHQFPMPTIVGDKVLIGGDALGTPDPFWSRAMNHGGTYVAYSLKDGSEIWRLLVPQPGYGPGTYGMCGTPVIEGDRVYLQIMHEVMCLDLDGMADGNDGMQEELEIMTWKPFELPEGETMPTEAPSWAADIIWHYSLKPFDVSVQDATCSSIVEVDGQLWIATANQIGHEARAKEGHDKPRMVVLDKEDGSLIATDDIEVPIVFHGEWSSPSLIEVNGEKAVLFPDGYGVLNAFAIPTPAADGSPVKLETLWRYDVNPKEYRYHPDGREIVYTMDKRLDFKYPEDYYTNLDKYYMFEDKLPEGKHPNDFESWSSPIRQFVNGRHEEILGPCEIISTPAVVGNRIYLGIGRDGFYGLDLGKGRFVCLEVEDVHKEPRLVWEDREIGRTQCTASIADGFVYVADGQGMLNCWDADTGEVKYRQSLNSRRIRERSQILIDGKIYISNDSGMMMVFKAGPEPVLLGESRLKGSTATVEAVDGLIVVATHKEVMLYGDPAALEQRLAQGDDLALNE